MSEPTLRPMGIGRILDRSFQLYRTHFVTLAILMLVMYGPALLLTNVFMGGSTTGYGSIFSELSNGGNIDSYLENIASDAEGTSLSGGSIVLGVIGIIATSVLTPVVLAAVVHLVRSQLKGEPAPGPGQLLKLGFSRFWSMLGSSLLYGLIITGMYALVLGIIAVVVTMVAISAVAGSVNGPLIALLIVIVPALIILISFFALRWSYFLPFVALSEEGVGIRRSWRLTKGSFWRLLLMYIILGIIVLVISSVISLLTALLGGGVLSRILYGLVSIVIGAMGILPYAVSFFDLRVRREGYGLDTLLGGASPAAAGNPAAWNDSAPLNPDNRV